MKLATLRDVITHTSDCGAHVGIYDWDEMAYFSEYHRLFVKALQ